MSTNLQNLLRDALLNNTYDYSVVHETLKNTWTNSYSYLYQLQKSYIDHREYTFISNDNESRENTIGHLYVNKSLQACFDIPYDFIHVVNREEFKHSKFYEVCFTFNDMVDNPQIFHKLPIILIDGETIWDYKLYANNGSFTIVLPFNHTFVISAKRNKNTDDIVYLDHTIQLFIVDNILYERLGVATAINQNHILNTQNKTIELDTSLMSKSTDKEGIYFISAHIPNTHGEDYELGTILMPCENINNKLICHLSQSDYDRIHGHTKKLFVSVIFINRLHSHKFYTGNSYTVCTKNESTNSNECNLCIIQREECVPYAMPIPVENLIVIKERDGIISYVKNTDTVELFYPNIYRIKDTDRQEGDIYRIFYFYKYADSLKYDTIHHDFYYDFLKIHFNNELIEKIVDNIYHGKLKYIDNDTPDDTNTVYLTYPKTNDNAELDYIFVCEANDNNITYVIDGNVVTPAIVNEAFMNTFNRILHYKYYNYKYGEIDFIKRYLLEEGNENKDPIEYKDETLKEWIYENPDILREYVINQNKLYNPIYHLWTKNIDLDSRIRINTNPEFGEEHGFDLSEECYVFAFHNDQNIPSKPFLNLRIFIDGLLAVRVTHVRRYFTDYIYIPKILVTNDSYIEIEIFPSYEHVEMINFTSLQDEKEIQLLDPTDGIYPTAQDVFYIKPSGHIIDSMSSYTKSTPSNGDDYSDQLPDDIAKISINGITYTETEICDPELFMLTACYKHGEYKIQTTDSEKPVVFTRLKTFKVKPLSKDILNTDFALCIAKVPHGIEVKVQKDSFPYISLVGMNFTFDKSYIRIFRNGRLIPSSKYELSVLYSFPRINFFDTIEAGEILYIDVTPYRYKEIYYKEEIENDTIDLTGYIDKPFDIRYYDVYLNGRKLSLNNVISISPWKISLVNIKSKYHLHIFEKERDYEYFGTDFKTNKYYYTIDDLLESNYVLDDEKKVLIDKIINDTKDDNLTIIPNENTEEKIDYSEVTGKDSIFVYLFYTNDIVPIKFINPDKLQLNNFYVKTSYPVVSNTYYVKPADFARSENEYNRKSEYEGVYLLDPDIWMEGDDPNNENKIVYPITHLNTVDTLMFDTDDTE